MAKGMSRGFKITMGIIGIVIGFILMVMIIGAIGDASARGRLEEIRSSSLVFLESHIRTEQGNAVKYFAEAAEYAKDVTVDFYPYLDGESEISPELTKVVLDNLDAIARIEQGAKMEFHSYPYEYQKGASAELPDYFDLSKAIKLTCAKALFDLEHGRSDQSLDALLNVIQAGKLIASGTPVLFDVAIGNSFANQSLKVLHLGLASGVYDQEQVELIGASLARFESEWPQVGLSLEGEVCGLAVIFFDVLKNPAGVLQMGQLLSNSFGDVFRLFIFRLMCWKYFFSPARMYLSGHESMNAIVSEFNELEKMSLTPQNWEERKSKEGEFRENLDNILKGNLILNLTFPSVFAIYNRKLETLASIHAGRLACAIQGFRHTNLRFPVDLEELGGEVIFDFSTGKPWEYKNNGDSVSISSPGHDREDAKDDISLTLTSMGIGKYLQARRNAASGK
jgi:hypothetical protein